MSSSDEAVIEESQDTDFAEESSELEDEDELNHRIQKNASDSPNHHHVDIGTLARSQTDPPGNLSQFEHDYKGGTGKHIKRSHKKMHKLPKAKEISKSKSVQQGKHSYKRDDIDDIDVHSVEDEDIVNQIITEDEEYLDMGGMTPDDYVNSEHQKKSHKLGVKRGSSTLNNIKNGIMSAKKRLLSPDKTPTSSQANSPNMDSPDSPSTPYDNVYSPTTPNDNSGDSSCDTDDDSRGSKKKSVGSDKRTSFNILSKGKGLFNRTGSPQEDTHRTSGSKANLNTIKSKLQNIKKSYSKSNKTQSPTPEQLKQKKKKKNEANNHSAGSKKKSKLVKSKSKKKVSYKDPPISKSKKSHRDRLNPTKKDRHRSASTNKKTIENAKKQSRMKPKDNNVAMKRHSMIPMRSRSQNPSKKNGRQSLKPAHSKKEDSSSARARHRGKSKQLDLKKKAHSEYGNKSRREKDAHDSFTMHDSMRKNRKKSAHKLRTIEDSHASKLRRKSGGDGLRKHHDKKRQDQEEKEAIALADRKCQYRIKNEVFEVYEYYKPQRLIGSGAYAVVCNAVDERTKRKVAIKKNRHIFDDLRDARRILREIKLLLHFSKYDHPDLIKVYDTLPPMVSEIQDFEDVYIVMPLVELSLFKLIASQQKLGNLHYQYLTFQMLRGLAFIHKAGVIHRDIKPENILINGADCDLKIIDFGLARGVLGGEGEDNPENAKATEYVCTRWYRSPEVMCSSGQYDEKMDIWGVGCILGEMLLGRPLFPGANYMDQLKCIFDVMGTPHDIDWIMNDMARKWVSDLPQHNGKNLRKMIAHKFDQDTEQEDLMNCSDILIKMLELNPNDRISAADALLHPYFENIYDENECQYDVARFECSFEFEQSIKTKFGVRHMMYAALDNYHKEQWRKIKKKKQRRRAQKDKEKRERHKQRQKAKDKDKDHHKKSSKHHKHKSSKHK